MNTQRVLAVVFLGVVLSVLAGCAPTTTTEIRLNLAPQGEVTYKVVTSSGKDYSFVQPSINKTKERHTTTEVEVVFTQKIESVDEQGNATANITIKEVRYNFVTAEGKKAVYDSTTKEGKSDPVIAVIGQSYKIKLMPNGRIELIDAESARKVLKEGLAKKFADKLFSDEEVVKRHQVIALMDAGQNLYKKGDKWSVIVGSPEGMLNSKSFEKVYTLTDIKVQNGEKIAIVDMSAVPSLKRAADMPEDDAKANFFASMFDEKDNYTGQMVLNLTTGQIDSYQEFLKAEWIAAEPSRQQESDKGPDQLTMGFSELYSIEKINSDK